MFYRIIGLELSGKMKPQVPEWAACNGQYDRAIERFSKNKPKFAPLHTKFCKLTTTSAWAKDDLISLVEYKLSRGTFRPGLLQKVKSNSAGSIVTAIRDAQAAISGTLIGWEEVHQAAKILVGLFGVGPTTASLVLSCMSSQVPFMNDAALAYVLPSKPKYTMKEFQLLFQECSKYADMLEMDQREVANCMWTFSTLKSFDPASV